MILNNAGRMVEMEWLNLIDCFGSIKLHEYCVMPNHFHSILEINNNNNNNNVGVALVATQSTTMTQPTGQPQGFAPTHNHKIIGDMIGAFKSISTVQYIYGVKHHHWQSFNGKLWQRNYYEHIIRNESSY